MATLSLAELAAEQLDHCITGIDLDAYGTSYKGKVRNTSDLGDGRLVLVASDRISAFDYILGQPIPFKGQVLNQLAAYFFEATADIAPNHVIDVIDPNVTLAHRCEVVPVEFVVRGYLAGHAWRTYRGGGRTLCGVSLPDGLRESEQLPSPILTPATKAAEGHDEDISRAELLERAILTPQDFDTLHHYALALFERGTRMAQERGLLLVDTKYEFGRRPDGSFVVIDEIHTPDSSRYYYADTYEDRLASDLPQRQLSKEFVREWLMEHGFQGKDGQTMPELDAAFRVAVTLRYVELYEAVTGQSFVPQAGPKPLERIHAAIQAIV